jgi:NitT/TauT family transport system substrate-binding protein
LVDIGEIHLPETFIVYNIAVEHLRISATAHGLNYLPEYHASASGGFADLELSVESRACEVWTDVLDDLASGAADVVLGGLWVPAMYAGLVRSLVVIGQLNGLFPMAIVTREAVSPFDWSWMRDRTVLVPGAGGTAPYEFTAGLMREAGADLSATRFVRDLSTQMLTELFLQGLGDAIVCDLLTANSIAHQQAGVLTSMLAECGGPMPNSVYYVRADRLGELHGRLVRLMAGIGVSMAMLNRGSADQVSELLTAHWPGVPVSVLRDTTAQLIESGTWSGIRVGEQPTQRWVEMLRTAGLVTRRATFSEFVDMSAVDEAELLLNRS